MGLLLLRSTNREAHHSTRNQEASKDRITVPAHTHPIHRSSRTTECAISRCLSRQVPPEEREPNREQHRETAQHQHDFHGTSRKGLQSSAWASRDCERPKTVYVGRSNSRRWSPPSLAQQHYRARRALVGRCARSRNHSKTQGPTKTVAWSERVAHHGGPGDAMSHDTIAPTIRNR